MELWESYSALSTSSEPDITFILQSIIDAPSETIHPTARRDLIKLLLEDLKIAQRNGSRRLTVKNASQAFLALKILGKDQTGSVFLSSPENLSILLKLSSSFQNASDAVSEALRCIANVLLLVESSRVTFLQSDVDGGRIVLSMLEKASLPEHIFILSRILFFCTVAGPAFVQALVEEKHHGLTIIGITEKKHDILTIAILTGARMAREAMSELVKLTFNILHHYPKVIVQAPSVQEQVWNHKLDGFLSPLLRTFLLLPPTFPAPISPPLTHVIHALIMIPITPALRRRWFDTCRITRPSSGGSPKHSPPRLSIHQHIAAHQWNSPSETPSSSPTPSPTLLSPKTSALERALSAIAAGRKSFSRSSSSTRNNDVLQRAFDLFEVALAHHFPDDKQPDAQDVRDAWKAELPGTSLDDVLSPLVVLLTRFCIADESSRASVSQWIVPDSLDRSSPLERRSDTLGRCLRLLRSVYYPRLKTSLGEMLFAMSGSDAVKLSALVGYGNVAGFLFNKGILHAGSDPTLTEDCPNPMTSTVQDDRSAVLEMSEEEKEQEMDKLFAVFDHFDRTNSYNKFSV